MSAVMVRFGESCSTLSEPLVFQPHEQSPPLTPRKTVLSLKPLDDGSKDWGFTGTFEIAKVDKHPGLLSFDIASFEPDIFDDALFFCCSTSLWSHGHS